MWGVLKKTQKQKDRDAIAERLAVLERENAALLKNAFEIQQRFQRMARAVWRVEENERRRLASELHDNLGQVLTALRMRLERLPDGVERDAAVETAAQALEDIRNLSRLLRPPVLDDLGLKAALDWLARRTREDMGLPVHVVNELDAKLDADLETLVFRIIQEALTNTAKHANATRVEIYLRRFADRLELRVRDNGDGFDPRLINSEDSPKGVGLAGMRDRVSFFGGDLIINSSPGRGATIKASVRIPEEQEGRFV